MLPPLRFAASSSVSRERAVIASGLAGVRLDAEPVEVEAFLPAWPQCTVTVRPSRWASDELDLLELDEEVGRCLERHGRCELQVIADGATDAVLAEAAFQVAVRFQRFDVTPNPASATPFFGQILATHGRLYDRRRPLVAAAHDHALDTWRWLLRLEPHAGLSMQLAALFHGVERLDEAAATPEARAVADVLRSLQTPRELIDRTCAVLMGLEAERAAEAWGAALVAAAEALSFFSLEAPGFVRDRGPEHTARKVTQSLSRLDGAARAWLPRLKLPGAIRSLAERAS